VIRVAFGGVAALAGLFLVWIWLLGEALPGAFSPARARAVVRTLDLEELRGSIPEPASLARTAAGLVEERLEAAAFFEESPVGSIEVEPPEEAALGVEPSAAPVAERGGELEHGVDAALIRRMLAVYVRTGAPE
jgi:hypothetical protein